MSQNIEVSIRDVLYLAEGLDEQGYPNSIATISIEELIGEGKSKTGTNVLISKGNFRYAISGGCAVVQIDFPRTGKSEYNRIINLLDRWIINKDATEYENKVLITTIIPTKLKSQVILLFEDIVYFSGVIYSDFERIILCFDNQLSSVAEMESIDYKDIERQVEEELRKEEEQAADEYIKLQKELDELEDNYYEDDIKKYTDDLFDDNSHSKDDAPKKIYGMRIVKEE